MKQRKIAIMILLSFVTLGIYNIVWHYKFQQELREECGKGILASGHLLIVFVPLVNLVYYIYWHLVVDNRLVFIGAKKGNRWFLYLFLYLTVIGAFFVPAIIQAKANNLGIIDVDSKEKSQTELRVDKYAKYFNK